MVSHDLLPAKSGIFLDATYVPLYGSGANLKRLAPGGNSWDDKTDLGTRSLQGSAFRPRNHRPMHQVVPDVQTQLP
jgi:hypothetical protein